MRARRDLAALVPEGERVVLRIKPGLLSIVARRGWWHLGVLAAALVAIPLMPGASIFVVASAIIVASMVIWDALVWASRGYVLTDQRIAASGGVLNRWGVSVPLDRVQHAVISRRLIERLTGLGTIGVATAGTDAIDVAWVMIDRPRATLARVRDEVDRVRKSRPQGDLP